MYRASTIASGECASTSRRISANAAALPASSLGTGMCRNGSPNSLATGSRSVWLPITTPMSARISLLCQRDSSS